MNRDCLSKHGLPLFALLALWCSSCGDGADRIAAPEVHSQIDGQLARFELPGYSIVISNGRPFGIVSLRAGGQIWPFSHDQLPLGDWEWFWLEKADTSSWGDVRVKLLDPEWSQPTLTERGDATVVTYSRDDVVYEGIGLDVEYYLFAHTAAFDVHYVIHNGTDASLADPYVMVGFPGFLDNGRIVSVGTLGRADRAVDQPHASFEEEARARGRPEYLLQRSVDPTGAESARYAATVVANEGGRTFSLTSQFEADASFPYVFTAHTNKPGYLTSHLYAYMDDIPAGAAKRLVVHHSLQSEESEAPAIGRCADVEIRATDFSLNYLTLDDEGFALGVQGRTVHRIIDRAGTVEPLGEFAADIQGLHAMDDGTIIVSTDNDRWDPQTPCTIHRSTDGGRSFEPVKTIYGGCPLSWSLASDAEGNLFLGEYGPRAVSLSKRVWRSVDRGDTWSVVFTAPDVEDVHVHRVAVDPFTDDLWVTYGDGEHQGTYMSEDAGEEWTWMRTSQATAVAFAEDAIYWGEDTYQGVVTRYDRQTRQFEPVLDAFAQGYGGSVYDMAIGGSGCVYAPMVKYSTHSFAPSLWIGSGSRWDLLLEVPAEENAFGGIAYITGPDRFGVIHASGYTLIEK